MGCVAIETHYAGYRFRSRLEARWAVFFEHAGIEFQYEPEGFELNFNEYEVALREREREWHEYQTMNVTPEHARVPLKTFLAMIKPRDFGDEPTGFVGRYLPDFYLPKIDGGMYVEVKGYPDPLARVKCAALADGTRRCVLLVDTEPLPGLATNEPEWHLYVPNNGADFHYTFCYCKCRRTIGCTFDGRGARVKCNIKGCSEIDPHSDKSYSSDDPRLIAAALAARRARFGT